MSRNGITYLDVARCAEELTARHEEPTIERIRIRLKTGSNSTIGTHLRGWRARQDPLMQIATKEKIPEELIILLKGLWERVMVQAETQVDAIKHDIQQDLSQRQQIIQQLQQDNARLQQSGAQLKQTGDGLRQEKIALEKIIQDSCTEMATLQTKQDGLTQQLADKQTRIEELHKQNKQTQANLEHYRTASLEQRQQDYQRAEQRERALSQELQRLKMENELLRQQKTGLQQSLDQLQSAQNNLQMQLDQITLHHAKISTELMEANTALANKTASEQHWQIQHDNMHLKWQEQLQGVIDLKARSAVLSEQAL